LRQYDWVTTVLVALSSPRAVRRQIWQYLVRWSHVKPILNGRDLQKLGYRAGPQFKAVLDDLLAATLDGTFYRDGAALTQQQERARAFVEAHHSHILRKST